MFFSNETLNCCTVCHNGDQVKRQWYLYGYAVGRFTIIAHNKAEINRLLVEHGYVPLWRSSVGFECCVVPPSFDVRCNHCGKTFKNDRGLKRHVRLYHRVAQLLD